MTSFIITSAPNLPELQEALDKALAPVLGSVIVASSLMAVESARVSGVEAVVSLSHIQSSTTITSPYKTRVFQARTTAGLESAAAAFVAANPGYFISPLQVCRVDSTRHTSNFLGVAFYNIDLAQGVANWGLPVAAGSSPVVSGSRELVLASTDYVLDSLDIALFRTTRWAVTFKKGSKILVLEIVGSHDGATASDMHPVAMQIGTGIADVTTSVDVLSGRLRLVVSANSTGWAAQWSRIYSLPA